MDNKEGIRTLFLDIGGVILTNGWDHNLRRCTADLFHISYDALNERHHLTYDTYESGKLSFDDYLDRVIFFKPREFSKQDIKDFIFSQTETFQDMIELLQELKARYGLHFVAVSNEGRELMEYRVKHFELALWIDTFVGSSYVHLRKPDLDIYRLALDVAQTPPQEVLYIDDRSMFVEVAGTLDIHGIVHHGYPSTLAALAEYDLTPG
ncbi:MAG: HAD hydrolase-like protein [Anaerolineales bacterium]|jgi:putative hydrolase of the HAD superfamily